MVPWKWYGCCQVRLWGPAAAASRSTAASGSPAYMSPPHMGQGGSDRMLWLCLGMRRREAHLLLEGVLGYSQTIARSTGLKKGIIFACAHVSERAGEHRWAGTTGPFPAEPGYDCSMWFWEEAGYLPLRNIGGWAGDWFTSPSALQFPFGSLHSFPLLLLLGCELQAPHSDDRIVCMVFCSR